MFLSGMKAYNFQFRTLNLGYLASNTLEKWTSNFPCSFKQCFLHSIPQIPQFSHKVTAVENDPLRLILSPSQPKWNGNFVEFWLGAQPKFHNFPFHSILAESIPFWLSPFHFGWVHSILAGSCFGLLVTHWALEVRQDFFSHWIGFGSNVDSDILR